MSRYASQDEMPPDIDPAMYYARSQGRTPEEHAALEARLAERRATGKRGVGPASAPIRASAGLPSPVNGVRPAAYAPPPQRQQQQQHHQTPIRRVPPPQAALPQAVRSTAAIRKELLTPFGYKQRHPLRAEGNRGSGWHKKGYRDLGDMWINTNEDRIHTYGRDFPQEITLAEFVRTVEDNQKGRDYQPDASQDWDLRFRKRSLRQLLEDAESRGLGEEDLMLRDLFDGGETVYYSVLDENGEFVESG